MITRATLARMQREMPTLPWSAEDLDGLFELLRFWFPQFAELDELDLGDVRPFPPQDTTP